MILNIKSTNTTNDIVLNNNVSSIYLYETAYANYIDNIISNEEALARNLKSIIPVTESSYSSVSAIAEASISENVKARCAKLVEFVKSLFAKFMESLTKILLNQREYLKKYEDIIKKKRPKDGKISYTGDYDEGIRRCINTQVPVFNYGTYGDALKKSINNNEGDNKDEELIKKIMEGKSGFTYDAGETLDTMLKNYFIAAEKGENTHAFADLNFTEMYNFCYNFDDFEKNNKKDLNYLEQSTSAIVSYITDQSKSQTNTDTSTEPDKNADSKQEPGGDTDGKKQQVDQSNAIINNLSSYGYFIEADGENDKKAGSTGLSINTNAPSQMSSYDNRNSVSDDVKNANATAANGVDTSELQKMADKWNNVCRIIIGAKLNAVTQIAKDYMIIIREHVRSYVGTKDDTKDNRTAQQSRDYSQYKPKQNTQEEKKPQKGEKPKGGVNVKKPYDGYKANHSPRK